jgi:antitoxin component YwqK of YwqJK toxin-antitoxin module
MMKKIVTVIFLVVCFYRVNAQTAADTFLYYPHVQEEWMSKMLWATGDSGYVNGKRVSKEKFVSIKNFQDSMSSLCYGAKFVKVFDKKGRVILIGGWNCIRVTGNYVRYYTNGNKSKEVNYPDGNERNIGHCICYWENGEKKCEGDFGYFERPVRRWTYYDKDGKVMKEVQYLVCTDTMDCKIRVDTFVDSPRSDYYEWVDLDANDVGGGYIKGREASVEKFDRFRKIQDSLRLTQDHAKYIKRLDRKGRVRLVGEWDHDALVGDYVFYYRNGNKDEEFICADDQADTGHCVRYWKNGQKKAEGSGGRYLIQFGRWTYYDKHGKMIKQVEYNGTDKIGHCVYYWGNGQIKSEGDCVYYEEKHGHWIYYNKQGKVVKEKNY